jgi:predicted transcriptional regulator
MAVDFKSFQDVLKHPIRRKIIQKLNQTPNLTYTDLIRIVEAPTQANSTIT